MAISKKLISLVADILNEADEQDTEGLTQEALAEDILKAVAAFEKEEEEKSVKKKHLMVVGQVLFRGRDEPVVVGIGPFGGRAEKAARDEGGKLSWDAMSHRMGRFMVIPVYKSAFEANKDFAIKAEAEEEETEEFVAAMAEASWHLSDLPACTCGLRSATVCYRHEGK